MRFNNIYSYFISSIHQQSESLEEIFKNEDSIVP